jgi:hypothetical protein
MHEMGEAQLLLAVNIEAFVPRLVALVIPLSVLIQLVYGVKTNTP